MENPPTPSASSRETAASTMRSRDSRGLRGRSSRNQTESTFPPAVRCTENRTSSLPSMVEQEWQRAYAMLSLRLNRLLGGHALVYLGPEEWKREADAEPPPPPGLLAEDAEALLEHA